MKRFSFYFTLMTIFLTMFAHAQEIPSAEEQWLQDVVRGQYEGFYHASQLPPALSPAIDKLYIAVFAVTENKELSPAEYEALVQKKTLDQENAKKRMQFEKSSGYLKAAITRTADLVGTDYDCKKNRDAYKCQVNHVSGACAAFATHQGRQLWTAAHCPLDWAKQPGKSPVFYIYDLRGNKALGPQALSRLNLIEHRDWRVDYLENSTQTLPQDTLGFHLPIALPKFFKIGKAPQTNEVVFNLGFPVRTSHADFEKTKTDDNPLGLWQFRSRREGRNSEGLWPMFTQGQVLTLDQSGGLFRRSSLVDVLEKSPEVFVHTGDSVAGFSGGPIVNQSGEVVGVFSSSNGSSYTVDEEEYILIVSVGIRPRSWPSK